MDRRPFGYGSEESHSRAAKASVILCMRLPKPNMRLNAWQTSDMKFSPLAEK